MARDQILHGGSSAPIGHKLYPGAGVLLKIGAEEASPSGERPRRHLAWICLQPGDQLLQIPGCHRLVRNNESGSVGEKRNRFKVADQVVWQRVGSSIKDVGRDIANADDIAVGRRAYGLAYGDTALRSTDILDDDRLAKGPAHSVGDDTRNRVGRPSCGEWNDQSDGPAGIALS